MSRSVQRVVGKVAPDAFSAVMATGIVSVAAADQQYRPIATVLGAIAAATFVVLAVVVALHVARVPAGVLAASREVDVTLRSFAFVAACDVLAAQWPARTPVVATLAVVALAAWLPLGALLLADVRASRTSRLRSQAHGSWLLAAAATESLAVSAADLAARTSRSVLVWCAVVAWLLGLALYLLIAWLVLGRIAAARTLPQLVTPGSWILMGGLAIATLAGTGVLSAAHTLSGPDWPADVADPAIRILWIASSVWIPLLAGAEVWRIRGGHRRVHSAWASWSMVFPLGMYSAATFAVADDLHLDRLKAVSTAFFWVAAISWLLVAGGVARRQFQR